MALAAQVGWDTVCQLVSCRNGWLWFEPCPQLGSKMPVLWVQRWQFCVETFIWWRSVPYACVSPTSASLLTASVLPKLLPPAAQAVADRIAEVFVPIVVVVAALVLVIWMAVGYTVRRAQASV